MPSFFTPELDNNSTKLVLNAVESHHLAHVMRLKHGDEVNLNSGQGWMGKGIVREFSNKLAIIDVTDIRYIERPKPAFAIAFSLLRNKNDELLLEKATELGAQDFFPLQLRNSVRTPSANTEKRFTDSVLTAIKQCNNPWLPNIHPIARLTISLQFIRKLGYIPVAASEARPDVWLDSLNAENDYCFIIGPEGGFSIEETELLRSEKIPGISLSGNILRAETAAIAVAAQFNLLRRK